MPSFKGQAKPAPIDHCDDVEAGARYVRGLVNVPAIGEPVVDELPGAAQQVAVERPC